MAANALRDDKAISAARFENSIELASARLRSQGD